MHHINQSSYDVSGKAIVTTSQPVAAQIGQQILAAGGNAIDAAIATAVALTVVEPTCNGIGGDIFAQVWYQGELYGLNASSIAPELMTPEELSQRGYESMPGLGIETVTVPGAPAGWMALHERFATMPLEELFAPGIELAKSGFEVTPTVAFLWQQEYEKFSQQLAGTNTFEEWSKVFTKDGKLPKAGEQFILPDHARTLLDIAQSKAQSFYTGELAAQIEAYSQANGGFIRQTDLAAYSVDWVEPICTDYRGYQIWEMPPNGQGLVVLMALNLLKEYEFSVDSRQTLATLHKQIEAMKLSYTDGQMHIAQPNQMQVKVEDLLSEEYADGRRALITEQALEPFAGSPSKGGTVYLASADAMGNMVSMMQSNFYGFGSGVVVPGTGIALHNRGSDFSLDPKHANYLQAGKRSFHTIIPGFITKTINGKPQAISSFGVMGAYMQPQGQLQVLMNMLDFELSPQQALDTPRWQWFGGKSICIEEGFGEEIFAGLKALGHDVHWAEDSTIYGRGQIVCKNTDKGHYYGGSEPRCDGKVAAVD